MSTPDPSAPPCADSLARKMLRVFEDGSPAIIRDCGDLFSVQQVFAWIQSVHTPARSRSAPAKIVAVKQSWGLSAEGAPDAALPDPGRGPELYRDGALLLDPSPYLPTDTETFETWVERGRTQLGGSFGLMAPGLECASWDAMQRLRTLLGSVLALTGPRAYRYNAFLGDYRRTPFGFHLDPHQECVFQYVLHGERRGFFWEGLTLNDGDAHWIEDTNGLHSPGREPEVVLEARSGDLVFWPGTHAHGFESSGASMALSLVIDRTSPRTREAVVSGLELATMAGTAALPAVDESLGVPSGGAVQRRFDSGLAYERHDDTLVVGVCGRTFDWPDPAAIPSAMRLFDFLRSHASTTLEAIMTECADRQLSREDVRGVLGVLASLGYFEPPAA